MITQTIRVTAEHIRRGTRDACTKCPVALAILATAGIRSVRVHPDEVTVRRGPDGLFLSADLPQDARDFIDAFDASGPGAVQPFEFTVTWRTNEERRWAS
jgi:hypothetical protein